MHGGHVGSEQIPTLFLGAAVYAHHGLFGADLALQKPISHTEISPLGPEVDGARHNLEVETWGHNISSRTPYRGYQTKAT